MNPFAIIVTHTVAEDFAPQDSNGTATRGMIRQRAVQLAVIGGRPPHETSRSDWDQARTELVDRRCAGIPCDFRAREPGIP